MELKLTSVDQLTYSEFVFSLESPTCFTLLNAPALEGQLILDAMGAGKPVVVLKSPFDSNSAPGFELVGTRELIAPGEADYVEIADRLLRTPVYRADQGRALQERFRTEFRPEHLGRRYKEFIGRVVL